MNTPSHSTSLPKTGYEGRTLADVQLAAAVVDRHLAQQLLEVRPIIAVDKTSILPFAAAVYPVNNDLMSRFLPNFTPPSVEQVAQYHEYASAKVNYGTAPAEAAALIEQITVGLQPETAFVFGTARGRIEQIIALACSNAAIATIDLPTEVINSAVGRPDSNNLRYRKNIGIVDDSYIGDIFRNDQRISSQVTQILGDSFTADFSALRDKIRLIVIDANHALPNSLLDLGNALDMAHTCGGIIVVDDFRKVSPLNAGVDAAVSIFSELTGLPALWPCPRPGEAGFTAAAAIFVVPDGMPDKNELAELVRTLARQLKSSSRA